MRAMAQSELIPKLGKHGIVKEKQIYSILYMLCYT